MAIAYTFGPFELDPQSRRLLRHGEPVALPSRAFDVLVALVDRRGRVVEKEELLRVVWPDVVVEDGNLTQHVFTIRKILGKNSDSVPYVATIPRRGYQFVADVQTVATPHEPLPAPPILAADFLNLTSIAVLPFVPLGYSEADRSLGLGMADALIMRLGNVRQAVVRPTSSIRQYVGVEVDPVAAARELRVRLIVEGSIQRSGDRIRVSVQLVDAREGSALWGARFDERLPDIFAIQDSIAEQVAAALVPQLTDDERRRLTMHDTGDIEAYSAYLKGRQHFARRTHEALQKAVDHFEEAIRRDAMYAMAYAGLAECCTILGSAGYDPRARAYADRARKAALKAVELRDEIAETHVALGLVRFRLDWRWLDAEREFTKATNLNGGLATAYHFYALYLAAMGRLDEAWGAIRRAQALDPLSLIVHAAAGRVRHFARAYEQAIAQYRAALELDAQFADAHMNLGLTYVELARYNDALRELDRAAELSGRRDLILAMKAYACGVAGDITRARHALEDLEARAEQGSISAMLPTYGCIGIGEHDRAFRWLDRAVADHAGLLIYLKVEPMFDRLRADPRLITLMRRLDMAC